MFAMKTILRGSKPKILPLVLTLLKSSDRFSESSGNCVYSSFSFLLISPVDRSISEPFLLNFGNRLPYRVLFSAVEYARGRKRTVPMYADPDCIRVLDGKMRWPTKVDVRISDFDKQNPPLYLEFSAGSDTQGTTYKDFREMVRLITRINGSTGLR